MAAHRSSTDSRVDGPFVEPAGGSTERAGDAGTLPAKDLATERERAAASPRGPVLSANGFSAELSHGASGAVLTLRGAMMSSQPAALLIPFLDEVHQRVLALGCERIHVDLRQLEHLGPAALGALLHWTDALRDLPEGKRYEIVCLCAPGRRWQHTSLSALQCAAAGLVKVGR